MESKQLDELLLKHVRTLHGTPKSIVSKQGSLFSYCRSERNSTGTLVSNHNHLQLTIQGLMNSQRFSPKLLSSMYVMLLGTPRMTETPYFQQLGSCTKQKTCLHLSVLVKGKSQIQPHIQQNHIVQKMHTNHKPLTETDQRTSIQAQWTPPRSARVTEKVIIQRHQWYTMMECAQGSLAEHQELINNTNQQKIWS